MKAEAAAQGEHKTRQVGWDGVEQRAGRRLMKDVAEGHTEFHSVDAVF